METTQIFPLRKGGKSRNPAIAEEYEEKRTYNDSANHGEEHDGANDSIVDGGKTAGGISELKGLHGLHEEREEKRDEMCSC